MNLIETKKELKSSIPVTKSISTPSIIYSINIPASTTPRSYVILTAQAEITNPYGHVVGLGRYIKRSDGKIITPKVMSNISPQEHHKVVNISVVDKNIPTGAFTYTMEIYVVYSGLTGSKAVKVEKGYGFLQALVF